MALPKIISVLIFAVSEKMRQVGFAANTLFVHLLRQQSHELIVQQRDPLIFHEIPVDVYEQFEDIPW